MTTNCVISIANFGRARVRATRVVTGMSVVAYASESQSRTGAAFYPSKRTSGSFELTLVFAQDRSYRRVCEWLERYSRWSANPKTPASAARVMIPARKFDMVGVIRSGIEYGDAVSDVTHSVTMSFVGARDPLDLRDPAISRFRMGRNRKDKALPYFYPAGRQLRGDAYGSDFDWDTQSTAIVNPKNTAEAVLDRHRQKTPVI